MEKQAEIIDIIEPEIENSGEIENIIPKMNVAIPESKPEPPALIPDEQYLGVLNELLDNVREDRKQVSEYIDNFADMVFNEGDATSASKETLVNMVKIKSDLQDKMLKALDLMGRMKSKNTYAYSGPHLNAMQQNNINIGSEEINRRELIRTINKAKRKNG